MSKVKVDTIEDTAGTQNIPVDTVINGSAKAWVKFNGVTTTTILSSFNVSSLVDGGTGKTTINFSNAFTAADDFVWSGSARENTDGGVPARFMTAQRTVDSASSVDVTSVNGSGSYADSQGNYFAAHGDLA